MRGRVRVDVAATPERNMELDEAALAAREPWQVRVYRWQPAGLSLGRFQDPADFADVPGEHRIVRRVTGGGAIYHERELTFALAYDLASLPLGLEESYRTVHELVRAVLARFGVRSELVREGKAAAARPVDRWCFAVPGRNDLVDPAGRKLVGSAQRRVRMPSPRVLHHGSLVLATPRATPFCAAVDDQVDALAIETDLAVELASALARLFPGDS